MSTLKPMPANVAAERSLLGALLAERDAIIGVAPQLAPGDFYDQQHATVYAAILELYRRRVPPDLVLLREELGRPSYGYQGGAALLADLMAAEFTAVHAPHYLDLVREAARKRRILAALEAGLRAAYEPEARAEDVEALLDRELLAVRQASHGNEYLRLYDAVELTAERLDAEQRRERLVFSGYHALDRQIGGFEPGQLVVIAGRPGVGKTAAAVQIAYEHGVRRRRPVGFLSLEMSEMALVGRMLAIRGQLDMHAVRQLPAAQRPQEMQERLAEATGYVAEGAVWIIRRRSHDIAVLAAQARDMRARFAIECLLVDYLQLMGSTRRENRTQEVSDVSRGLKAIAMELEIPVIALAQLNREVERRGGDAHPRLADLRESGQIEQDSDIVVFLHRDLSAPIASDAYQDANFIVAKHREGPTGFIPMLWHPRTEQYVDATTEVRRP